MVYQLCVNERVRNNMCVRERVSECMSEIEILMYDIVKWKMHVVIFVYESFDLF